jgi:hypothetical protein
MPDNSIEKNILKYNLGFQKNYTVNCKDFNMGGLFMWF